MAPQRGILGTINDYISIIYSHLIYPVTRKLGQNDVPLLPFVALTRLAFFILIVLSDIIIPDHNATDVLSLNYVPTSEMRRLFLRPFIKWDSAHFIAIAEKSYYSEQSFAFFPFYPSLIGYLGRVLGIIFPLDWNLTEQVIVAGIIVSNVSFVASVWFLNKLFIYLDVALIRRNSAIMCYIFNPASVFFCSLYTESTYAMLSFAAIYFLFARKNHVIAFVLFSLASFTRSTGIFNSFLVLFHSMSCSIGESSARIAMTEVLSNFVLFFGTIFPFFYFNHFAATEICESFPDPSICDSPSIFHFDTYAHIQHKYWNVGFLRSFRFMQLPNVILAFPIAFLAVRTFVTFDLRGIWIAWLRAQGMRYIKALPLVGAMIPLVLVSFIFGHIQILNRVVCAGCPLVYLAMADTLEHRQPHIRNLFMVYVFIFNACGVILHPNFYPWT
jgi:Gpi18-like mannosyltransferase